MFTPNSLRQRLTYYLLIPVVVLLLGMGFFGFNLGTRDLLIQWHQNAILWTQRSAHAVDMRLQAAKQWMLLFHATAEHPQYEILQDWIIAQAEAEQGVERVRLESVARGEAPEPDAAHTPRGPHLMYMDRQGHGGPSGMARIMPFRRAGAAQITLPRYDDLIKNQTVSLESDLLDADGGKTGSFEITVRFDYLLGALAESEWWRNYQAFLVDQTGTILAGNQSATRRRLGDNGSALELATLQALQQGHYGTLLGKGHPPNQVSAFYRLMEAPWSLVILAPGDVVLAPIVRFRRAYITGALGFIVIVVLLIRRVTGTSVKQIKAISEAAQQVAAGQFEVSLAIRGRDEVAQLGRSFNTMVRQLQERIVLKEALDLAMEVQQSLLPRTAPLASGLDLAGRSIYCDQTGGDYYDFLPFAELGPGRLAIAVGDVVGHGIAAALLMASARAFLRGRVMQPGRLGEIITDVNRLLCLDTADTGNFMTLFLLLVDTAQKELVWVRAGHDPAVIFDPDRNRFSELRGSGTALGLDDTLHFEEYHFQDWHPGQIILIGTDGIWETENDRGERFGKERLNAIMREQAERSAADILEAVTTTLVAFRGTAPQSDDVTLVVVKIAHD